MKWKINNFRQFGIMPMDHENYTYIHSMDILISILIQQKSVNLKLANIKKWNKNCDWFVHNTVSMALSWLLVSIWVALVCRMEQNVPYNLMQKKVSFKKKQYVDDKGYLFKVQKTLQLLDILQTSINWMWKSFSNMYGCINVCHYMMNNISG